MKYIIEQYQSLQRFNEQYAEIYRFLLAVADRGYNEHFHWGRFEWMMGHSLLEVDNLGKIGIVKNQDMEIVGLVTYDTRLKDSVYLLHSSNDKELLKIMIDFAMENYDKGCRVNAKDSALRRALSEYGFQNKGREDNVLEIDLNQTLNYQIPKDYRMSPPDFVRDDWKYQMVIHKGFNHEGIPKKLDESLFSPTPNFNRSLKVFALNGTAYCAHCGVWYTQGNTAYIEPVVTIPECRKLGLGKAVVYEAMNRARELGAKSAIVLSNQNFYYRIGFQKSSVFNCWEN